MYVFIDTYALSNIYIYIYIYILKLSENEWSYT